MSWERYLRVARLGLVVHRVCARGPAGETRGAHVLIVLLG
jgi:hypothetical protein